MVRKAYKWPLWKVMTRAKQQVLLFHTLLLARGPACSCHGSSIKNWEIENKLHVLCWSGSLLWYNWPKAMALVWVRDGFWLPLAASVWWAVAVWLWLCSVTVLHQEIPKLIPTNQPRKAFFAQDACSRNALSQSTELWGRQGQWLLSLLLPRSHPPEERCLEMD